MKAILEFDAPESCVKCRLCSNPLGYNFYCAGYSGNAGGYFTDEFRDRRAPFCPLQIKPDTKSAGVRGRCHRCLRDIDDFSKPCPHCGAVLDESDA